MRTHPDVWIYADEIYSKLVYDGEFVSIASLPGMRERTIISDGASKTYAMTGWRIGFAANKALAPVFTRWITNTESCASQISQWAALQALTGPQHDAEAMKQRFHARRDLIVRRLNAVPGFRCASPGGAFYAWPNVTEACRLIGARDSEELRRRLLLEAGVAVLADIHFGPRVEGEGQHIRFSYATSEIRDRAGHRSHRRVHAKGPTMSFDTAKARDEIFQRIRSAQKRERLAAEDRAAADDYLARHPAGPQPRGLCRICRRNSVRWPSAWRARSKRSAAMQRRAGRRRALSCGQGIAPNAVAWPALRDIAVGGCEPERRVPAAAAR